MAELVLAFKQNLGLQLPHKGFIQETEMLPVLLNNAEFVERDKVENDPTFKQFIAYSILRYEDKLLSYRRSVGGTETRLYSHYSIGWGGHVNSNDYVLPIWDNALIYQAVFRELEEEIGVDIVGQPNLIGLVNDESNEVGQVHLGIVYEFWLKSPLFTRRYKQGHRETSFVSLSELISSEIEYENWSQMIVHDYLRLEQDRKAH